MFPMSCGTMFWRSCNIGTDFCLKDTPSSRLRRAVAFAATSGEQCSWCGISFSSGVRM